MEVAAAGDNSRSSDDTSKTNENETPPPAPMRPRLTQAEEFTLKRKELQRKQLSKKMRRILEEYAVVVGEQASLIYADPTTNSFRSYGTRPLTGVINKSKDEILKHLAEDLDKSLNSSDEYLTYLPLLELNGRRVNIEEATQGMLRTLLPRLLKISSGCGRPGWGIFQRCPSWWPIKVLPWSNVRIDRRDEQQKSLMSWTQALRTAVISCYAYHGRLDLLHVGGKTGEGQADKGDEGQANQIGEAQVTTTNEGQVNKIDEGQINKIDEGQVNKAGEGQFNNAGERQVNKGDEGASSTAEETVCDSSPNIRRYVLSFAENGIPQLRLQIAEGEQTGDETLSTGMNFVLSNSAGVEYSLRE